MSDPGTTMDRIERRRNPADMVNRADFESFKNCVEGYRREAKRERQANMETITARLDDQDDTLTRINIALFAKDDNNEFESRGVMTVMRKLDHHIDTVCKLGRAAKYVAIFVVTILGPGAVIGRQMGWW